MGRPKAAPFIRKRITRSVRNRSLRIWRECRIHLRSAQKIERHIERLVVLGIRRDVRLRASLLLALVTFQMAAQRSLTLRIRLGLQVFRNVLKDTKGEASLRGHLKGDEGK